jgi:hypothetical protein
LEPFAAIEPMAALKKLSPPASASTWSELFNQHRPPRLKLLLFCDSVCHLGQPSLECSCGG